MVSDRPSVKRSSDGFCGLWPVSPSSRAAAVGIGNWGLIPKLHDESGSPERRWSSFT